MVSILNGVDYNVSCGNIPGAPSQTDKNPDSLICRSLIETDRNQFLTIMSQVCNTADKLQKYQSCQEYCTEAPSCRAYLKDFCANLVGDKKYEDICGCAYPDIVYKNYKEGITSLIISQLPLDSRPECFFPPCIDAKISTTAIIQRPCQTNNIVLCLSEINFNNNGVIQGPTTVSSDQRCSIFNNDTSRATTTALLWVGVAITVIFILIISLIVWTLTGSWPITGSIAAGLTIVGFIIWLIIFTTNRKSAPNE